jgi:hypothetical protein
MTLQLDMHRFDQAVADPLALNTDDAIWSSMTELNRRAFTILSHSLGLPETLRFFSQFGLDRENQEKPRELVVSLTVEEFERRLEEEAAKLGTDSHKE